MEQERAVSPRLIDGDTEFHVELARATGNPVLVLMTQTIMGLLRTERLREDFTSDLPMAFASHREIVDAIADGDGDRAEHAMIGHLAHVARPRSVRDLEVTRVAS